MSIKNKSAVIGVGHTEYAKNIGRSEAHVALEAIQKAVADAGLTTKDIDGMVRFDMDSNVETELTYMLGIPNLRFFAEIPFGGGAGAGTIALGAMAVATGQATNVVCFRSRNRGSGQRPWAARGAGHQMTGTAKYHYPYGLLAPVQEIAMFARRYMHETGTTSRMLGAAAVAMRNHAIRNPNALMRKPITVEDHQQSRFIAEPLHLLDCCLESDGAAAVIVSSAERARDGKNPPVYIRAAIQATGPMALSMTNYYREGSLASPSAASCAQALYAQAELTPGDIDVAQFYCAFSPQIPQALEAYGFCGTGEGGPFIEAGGVEWPNGRLPVNTHGGALSEAYIHGYNDIVEAIRQVRGTSTSQVADVDFSIVTSATQNPTGAVIFAKEM
jgi:acetyl-CoA acetyltransferase